MVFRSCHAFDGSFEPSCQRGSSAASLAFVGWIQQERFSYLITSVGLPLFMTEIVPHLDEMVRFLSEYLVFGSDQRLFESSYRYGSMVLFVGSFGSLRQE